MKRLIVDLSFIALGFGGFLVNDALAFGSALEGLLGVSLILCVPFARAYAKRGDK